MYRGSYLGLSLQTVSKLMGASRFIAKKYLQTLPESYTLEDIGELIAKYHNEKALRKLSHYFDL